VEGKDEGNGRGRRETVEGEGQWGEASERGRKSTFPSLSKIDRHSPRKRSDYMYPQLGTHSSMLRQIN